MDSLKVNVAHLADDNYPTWSDRICSLLTLRDCKQAILTPARLPDEVATSEKALAIIKLHVSDRWLRRIANCRDAYDTWVLLREEHTTALATLASSIHAKLFATSMAAGQTVDQFIDGVEVLQADLERLNMALPEGETVLMIAARTGNLDAINALLDRGADVNAREGWKGQTALMWAAADNNTATVGTSSSCNRD